MSIHFTPTHERPTERHTAMTKPEKMPRWPHGVAMISEPHPRWRVFRSSASGDDSLPWVVASPDGYACGWCRSWREAWNRARRLAR